MRLHATRCSTNLAVSRPAACVVPYCAVRTAYDVIDLFASHVFRLGHGFLLPILFCFVCLVRLNRTIINCSCHVVRPDFSISHPISECALDTISAAMQPRSSDTAACPRFGFV